MSEMRVVGVRVELPANQPILLLRETSGDRYLPIWIGSVEATATGTFRFQTRSNDGIRLWVNGNLLIDHWTKHTTATDFSADIALVKDQRYTVTLEMYDDSGTGVAKLLWLRPGTTTYSVITATRLYAN